MTPDERLARLRELAVAGRHPGTPVLGADTAAVQTRLAIEGYSGLYARDELEAVWAALDAGDYEPIVSALTHYTFTFERAVGIRR